MALKNILTQERVNQLASSMTQKQAAAFLRVSYQHFSTTLKQLDFKWERALKYKLTQQKLDEMAQTMNQNEVAVMLGVERPTLSTIITKLGLRWNKPAKQRAPKRNFSHSLAKSMDKVSDEELKSHKGKFLREVAQFYRARPYSFSTYLRNKRPEVHSYLKINLHS